MPKMDFQAWRRLHEEISMKEECSVDMAGLQPNLPVLIKNTATSLTIRRESCVLQNEPSDALEKENFVSAIPVLEAWSRWDKERFAKGKDVMEMVELYASTNVLITRTISDYMSGRYTYIPHIFAALTELLRVSDMLLIPDLKQFCINCIIDMTVNEANCFDILETSSVYNFEHPGMNKYIRGHLLSLTKSKRMLNLSYDSVQYLLNDEELSYWPEDDRFVLITNWCRARIDRLSRFELLFDSLDLNKIDRDIVWSVVKNDELVRESRPVTLKINRFLQLKEKENIPTVYLLGYEKELTLGCFGYEITEEKMFGFNMEENKSFRLDCPSFIRGLIRNIPKEDVTGYFRCVSDIPIKSQLITNNGRGNIILYEDGKIHEYDVTTNECNEMNVLLDRKKFTAVTHVLFDESLVFFGKTHVLQSQSRSRRTKYDFKTRKFLNRTTMIPFTQHLITRSTLYCVKTDTEQDLELKAVRSFAFEISCACISGSKIFLTTTDNKHKGQIMCFDLNTGFFSVIYRLRKSYSIFFPTIKRMSLTQDQLVLVTNGNILSISRIDFSENFFQEGVCTTFEYPIYVHLYETIIEVCSKNIRIIEFQAQDPKKVSTKSITFTPKHLRGRFHIAHAIVGSLPRTKPICHIMCPHCVPEACEKEESEKNGSAYLRNAIYITTSYQYWLFSNGY